MGDWPKALRVDPVTGAARPPMPLFSWCASTATYDMLLPTYKMMQANVFGKDVEQLADVDAMSYMHGGPWASKRDVGSSVCVGDGGGGLPVVYVMWRGMERSKSRHLVFWCSPLSAGGPACTGVSTSEPLPTTQPNAKYSPIPRDRQRS